MIKIKKKSPNHLLLCKWLQKLVVGESSMRMAGATVLRTPHTAFPGALEGAGSDRATGTQTTSLIQDSDIAGGVQSCAIMLAR